MNSSDQLFGLEVADFQTLSSSFLYSLLIHFHKVIVCGKNLDVLQIFNVDFDDENHLSSYSLVLEAFDFQTTVTYGNERKVALRFII